MAGFVPDEGEDLMLEILTNAINTATFAANTDRIADLELGLFTNVAPGETITEAAITEPTGTGYARITLSDGSWTVSATAPTQSVFAQQTFTGGAGGWTGSIQGYTISTFLGGTGAKRLYAIEVDGNGPYTINVNDTYKITPKITLD